MDFFPAPSKKDKEHFETLYETYLTNVFSQELYIFVLTNCGTKPNEQNVFDLDSFNLRHNVNNRALVQTIARKVAKIYKNVGWNVAMCFGDTCVAIFDERVPPFVSAQVVEHVQEKL